MESHCLPNMTTKPIPTIHPGNTPKPSGNFLWSANLLVFLIALLTWCVPGQPAKAQTVSAADLARPEVRELGELIDSYETQSFKDEDEKVKWLLASEPKIYKAFPEVNSARISSVYWLGMRMAATSRNDETIRLLKEVADHTQSELEKANSFRLLGQAYLNSNNPKESIRCYETVLKMVNSPTNETLRSLRADFVNDALLKSAQANESLNNVPAAIELRNRYITNLKQGETNHFLDDYTDQMLLENARQYQRLGDSTNALKAYETLANRIQTNSADKRVWLLVESINARYPLDDPRRVEELQRVWTNTQYAQAPDIFVAGQQLATAFAETGRRAESVSTMNAILSRYEQTEKNFTAAEKETARDVTVVAVAKLMDFYSVSNDIPNLKRLLSIAKSEFASQTLLVQGLQKAVSDSQILQSREPEQQPRRRMIRIVVIAVLIVLTIAAGSLLFRKRVTQ
jgi:tetratricopeptide (TPR) repeat protein